MTTQEIEILPWRDEFAPEYRRLNRDWLEGHGLLEPDDLPYLDAPRERILDRGGAILCAVRDGEVVGTVALLRLDERTCELAKLAVAPAAQGRGLGRRLGSAALDLAASLGARRVVLSSSSLLVPALALYRSLGFRPSPPPAGAVAYRTADVHLALDLDPGPGSRPERRMTMSSRPAKRGRAERKDPLLEFCRSLPGATEDVKWEHDLIFSVGGKMFAGFALPDGEPLAFKVDPLVFDTLVGRDGIVPAPYMAKHSWVSVTDRRRVPVATLRDLLADSHRLVAAKLPARTRKALGLSD